MELVYTDGWAEAKHEERQEYGKVTIPGTPVSKGYSPQYLIPEFYEKEYIWMKITFRGYIFDLEIPKNANEGDIIVFKIPKDMTQEKIQRNEVTEIRKNISNP